MTGIELVNLANAIKFTSDQLGNVQAKQLKAAKQMASQLSRISRARYLTDAR